MCFLCKYDKKKLTKLINLNFKMNYKYITVLYWNNVYSKNKIIDVYFSAYANF
jgi:hypothetical protein